MRSGKLSESLGNINSAFIEEAFSYEKEEKSSVFKININKWISLTACLFAFLLTVILAFKYDIFVPDGGDGEINQNGQANSGDTKNEIYNISNGAFYLEICDSRSIPNVADVITVCIARGGEGRELYFRSSDKILGQSIRQIKKSNGEKLTENNNGVFILEFQNSQNYLYLDIYFDAETFFKSAYYEDGFDDGIQSENSAGGTVNTKNANVFFECSADLSGNEFDIILFEGRLSKYKAKMNNLNPNK